MSPVDHDEPALRSGKGGRVAAERNGESRPRVKRIELDQRIEGVQQRFAMWTDGIRQRAKDAIDFLDLVGFELPHTVAEFHGSRRLDE